MPGFRPSCGNVVRASAMNGSVKKIARRGSALLCWGLLWFSLIVLLGTQTMDALQRSAPPIIWAFWFLPLLILLPGLLKDRLRSVAWLSFVTLLYFMWAVLRLFAEPDSVRAVVELCAVIILFLSSMFYVRERAREIRADVEEPEAQESGRD